jgi:hypothetical protein
MYYNLYEGVSAQLGMKRESYPDVFGPSVKYTGIFAALGYTYR